MSNEHSEPKSQIPAENEVPNPRRAQTWGERMAQQARSIARRHLPVMPWLDALNPVFERVTALPVPVASRFQRREALPANLGILPEPMEEEATYPPGDLLAADLRARLQNLFQDRLPDIYVHADPSSDRLARSHRADAVTVGQNVYFREDHFRPREDAGFALLAHEATHVLQAIRPDAAWKRATQAGVSEQESEAGAQERRARDTRRFSLPVGSHPAGRQERFDPRSPERVPISPPAPAATYSAQRPMTAESDRDTALPAADSSMPSFAELRSALYRDLMSQIKADFERGG